MTPNSNSAEIFVQCTYPKFHHPMFTHSEVIVLTNTQTDRHCWKHPTLFATLRRWENVYTALKPAMFNIAAGLLRLSGRSLAAHQRWLAASQRASCIAALCHLPILCLCHSSVSFGSLSVHLHDKMKLTDCVFHTPSIVDFHSVCGFYLTGKICILNIIH